ncbi:MAG: MEDS domain-containing protein [Candidatus Nitrosopolaris sp.]
MNDFILQIRDRDHLALIYNEKSQFEEIVSTFIKRGINYNQINILVISKREESQFIQSLNKIEKIDFLFNSQDIMIILTDECFSDESYPVEPLFTEVRSISELAKEKSKCGLNVIGTLPARLIEQGKYEDAINIESRWHEALQKFEIPITPICLYKSIPDNIEDRFSEIHDLVIKHVVTSTGLL